MISVAQPEPRGAVIGESGKYGSAHCESRIRAATKSHYALQGAGVSYPGVEPTTSLNVFDLAISPVLKYGCTSVNVSDNNIKNWIKSKVGLLKNA